LFEVMLSPSDVMIKGGTRDRNMSLSVKGPIPLDRAGEEVVGDVGMKVEYRDSEGKDIKSRDGNTHTVAGRFLPND
jgi:hypothetical protein